MGHVKAASRRWMYRGKRRNHVAKFLNRVAATAAAAGDRTNAPRQARGSGRVGLDFVAYRRGPVRLGREECDGGYGRNGSLFVAGGRT
jgi:hypothetical protein